jgi:glycosyltransferase involved in cell wall biosynthesis
MADGKARRGIASAAEFARLDTKPIPADPSEIRVFGKVRNEAAKLPFFISYHQRLGVGRFFIVDNGSSDGTVEFLSTVENCHVFHTDRNMGKSRAGMDWIQPLLHRYGTGHWCLVLDADELFAYPASEQVGMPDFCRSLEDAGAEALRCLMIDMYPDGDIGNVTYEPGQPFLEACPLFDREGYQWPDPSEPRGTIKGGPRFRVFHSELLNRRLSARLWRRARVIIGKKIKQVMLPSPPVLNKVPLVRWNERMFYSAAAHDLCFARVADAMGVLLHFKYLGDFDRRVKEEVVRRAYFNNGIEYRRYHSRLKRGSINFKCDISERFTGTARLVELGLMKPLPSNRRKL